MGRAGVRNFIKCKGRGKVGYVPGTVGKILHGLEVQQKSCAKSTHPKGRYKCNLVNGLGLEG